MLIEVSRDDQLRWVGVCNDISEGGVRCASLQEPCNLFQEGDEVSFVTVLPVGRIEGRAGVVRVSGHSLALEFHLLGPELRERVRRYVRASRPLGVR